MAQNRYFCKIFACSYPPLLWGLAKGEKKAVHYSYAMK